MIEGLDAHELERLQRLIVSPHLGEPWGISRDDAIKLLAEVHRLQRAERRLREVLSRLRAIVSAGEEWLEP